MTFKTVILTWTQVCCNYDKKIHYWGLGDLIRGTIKMHQLSKKNNFNLIVNINLHPISLFLKKQEVEHNNIITDNINKILFVLPGKVEKFINDSKDNIIYFLTNDFCDEQNINDDCKLFIKNILTPNDLMTDMLVKHEVTDYDIIHLRLGDSNIGCEHMSYGDIQKYKNIIVSNIDINKKCILVCDSIYFKNILKNENFCCDKNIQMFDFEVGHIGYEQNIEKIKNSMFEFFIISKAKTIKTYSVYSWTSGFVHWISKIYDIPLVRIK